MSPRTAEFMAQARDRLEVAREVLASGHLESAVSAAYYAMLYAARAALSEDDEYARSHGGTWHMFHRRYVVTGVFDQHLHSFAQRVQKTREQGDSELDQAEAIVDGAAEVVRGAHANGPPMAGRLRSWGSR